MNSQHRVTFPTPHQSPTMPFFIFLVAALWLCLFVVFFFGLWFAYSLSIILSPYVLYKISFERSHKPLLPLAIEVERSKLFHFGVSFANESITTSIHALTRTQSQSQFTIHRVAETPMHALTALSVLCPLEFAVAVPVRSSHPSLPPPPPPPRPMRHRRRLTLLARFFFFFFCFVFFVFWLARTVLRQLSNRTCIAEISSNFFLNASKIKHHQQQQQHGLFVYCYARLFLSKQRELRPLLQVINNGKKMTNVN
jgi:hypothetical protein